MFIATRTKQAFKLGRSGTCQPLFWQAAPNVARKLFDPDRPEKSLHSDRLGSSDGCSSLVLDSQLARHRQLFDPIFNLCQ
jgi:hypothetical protein